MRKHRLVAIRDRLTQGFASGAIHFIEYAYPVIMAREMGLDDQESLYPQFHSRGWLLLNPWERGPETQGAPSRSVYHNLAILGFEVWDAYHPDKQLLKGVMCRTALRAINPGQASCLNYPTPISAAKQLAARWVGQEPNPLSGLERDPEMVTRLRLQEADEKAFASCLLASGITPCGSRTASRRRLGGWPDEAEAIGAEWVGSGEGAKREKK